MASYVDRLDRQGARRPPKALNAKVGKLDAKKRRESRLYNLTLDTNALRQQIAQLRAVREILYARILTSPSPRASGSPIQIAAEYLRLFRHGVQDTCDRVQPAFITSVAHEELSLGVTGFGRDMLLEQWRRYTKYFAVRENVFHAIEVVAHDEAEGTTVLRADGVIHGSFTMDALELVFPSVLQDPALTDELLGKPLAAPGFFLFHFNRNGLIVRHDSQTDFFATLATALGDPTRAARALESANIADEGIIDAPSETEERIEPVQRLASVKRTRFRTDREDFEHISSAQEEYHHEAHCVDEGAADEQAIADRDVETNRSAIAYVLS